MTASIASQRFRQRDADNLWYTAFRFSPAHGLGYERGITRRDPSCIIQYEGRYFVWYTRTQPGPRPVGHTRADSFLRAVPWDLADIWYATSADGHHWQEQGPAIQRGRAAATTSAASSRPISSPTTAVSTSSTRRRAPPASAARRRASPSPSPSAQLAPGARAPIMS